MSEYPLFCRNASNFKGGVVVLVECDNSDREILKNKVAKSIQITFEEALRLMAMLIPDEKQYKLARSKLLGVGNDQIRFMNREIDKYMVKYMPPQKEKIVFER